MTISVALLSIAGVILGGWYLCVRDQATQRSNSPTVSVLIIAAAVLMCVLLMRPTGARFDAPPPTARGMVTTPH